MKVNTLVVRALMALRLIDDHTLSHTMQIPPAKLYAWLYQDDADAVAYHRQLEILALLGIDEHIPRDDVVHHWTVVEPWMGSTQGIYWAIEVMTRAFGRAQAVFVAPESDPAFMFKAVARYGLRFDRFYALLEVKCPPMRSIRFDPAQIPGMAWMPGNFGVLLEQDRMPELLPGAMPVEQFEADVGIPEEMLKWERLSRLASTSRIKPEDVAKWIANSNPALSFDGPEEDEAVAGPGDDEDMLFTADEALPETPEPVTPEVAEDEAVAAVTDLRDERPVGPTGQVPRSRHPAFRAQHAARNKS